MGLEFQFRTMKSARELLYNSVPTGNTDALNPEKWLNGKLCDVVFTTIKKDRDRERPRSLWLL